MTVIMVSMKRFWQKEETIVLHIGEHPPAVHAPAVHAFKSRRFNWKEFVWDKMQFAVVSVFVFVLAYGFLNYQSIAEIIKFKVQRQTADLPKVSVLEQTDDKPAPIQASVLSVDTGIKSAGMSLPKLSAPVYPPDTRIYIPRIMKNIPVVGVDNENLIARKWNELEKDIQESLRNGVVHYPGTALPGEIGNVVFTGHSSYYAWDPGRFKDVFALLHEMKIGDKVYIFHNQKKFTYEIFDIRVVKPTEIDVLGRTNDERLTLITCTPLGTNLKRLVVTGKKVF